MDEYYGDPLGIVDFKVTAQNYEGLGQYQGYTSAWGPKSHFNFMYFIKEEILLF